jgi:hypothetical protein
VEQALIDVLEHHLESRAARFPTTTKRSASKAQVLADAETSYQDSLEATTAIRIYGTPTEQIMTTLRRSVGPDVQITILPTLLGGFSRR